jgi:hypothetical protein
MSMRGLVVALLCGALGLGIGVVVAQAAQPGSHQGGDARPIAAVSPSVPTEVPTVRPPSPDIGWPKLDPDLPLVPPDRVIGNSMATWHYRIPAGWVPFAVCSVAGECPPPMQPDDPLTTRQAKVQQEVRFRPPGEPVAGGFSLRVKALDNNLGFNPATLVSTKIEQFKQAFTDYQRLKRTDSAVFFTYRDGNNHLRYDFFQWFAASPSTTATLEMSVAGRTEDVPGLKALFNRFALIVNGTTEPYHPPKAPGSGKSLAQ